MFNYIRHTLEAIRVTQRGWSAGLNVSNVFIQAGGFWYYSSRWNTYNGYYWSTITSTLYTLYALCLNFDSGHVVMSFKSTGVSEDRFGRREDGLSIRFIYSY